MNLEPLFGKVFIKRLSAPKQESIIWTPVALPEDEGEILNTGGCKDLKIGDKVKFALRGSSEIQFENEFIISVDIDQILAII